MGLVANLFFFFSLNPFFSPLPVLNTDTTPISHIISLFTFIYLLCSRKDLNINKPAIILLIFSLFSFFFYSFDGSFELRHRVGLFGAFLIYWFSTNYFSYFRFSVLKISIFFHTFFVLFHYILPSYFLIVATPFVRAIKVQDFSSGRGASGLAAENSFSAALGIVYIILLFWFYKNKAIKRSTLILYLSISLIPIVLSFSGLGIFIPILLGLIYILFILARKLITNPLIINKKSIKLFLFIVLVILPLTIYSFSFISSTRGIYLITTLIKNPSVVLSDTSLSQRFLMISVGYFSLFQFPFGAGGGTYANVVHYLDGIYNLRGMFPGHYGGIEGTVSAFGRYTVEFGIIFLLVYGYLFIHSLRSNTVNILSILSCILSLLYVIASFSILFPPTYLLLAASAYRPITQAKNLKHLKYSKSYF